MYNYHIRVLTVPVNVRRIQLHGGAPSAVPTAHVAPQAPTHLPTYLSRAPFPWPKLPPWR